MGELRESKKREGRPRISDVATALFFERGFEAVTLDEIALAAKVFLALMDPGLSAVQALAAI